MAIALWRSWISGQTVARRHRCCSTNRIPTSAVRDGPPTADWSRWSGGDGVACTSWSSCDAATKQVRPVVARAGVRVVNPSWTADGRSILFAANVGDEPFNIYAVSVGERSVRRVTDSVRGVGRNSQLPTHAGTAAFVAPADALKGQENRGRLPGPAPPCRRVPRPARPARSRGRGRAFRGRSRSPPPPRAPWTCPATRMRAITLSGTLTPGTSLARNSALRTLTSGQMPATMGMRAPSVRRRSSRAAWRRTPAA